jgi:hypothetical protein
MTRMGPLHSPPDPRFAIIRLDAAHASHVSPRANIGRGRRPTRAVVLPLWHTVADAARSRKEARAQDAAAAPDGQRQGGRGGPVCRVGVLEGRGCFPTWSGCSAKSRHAGTQ